ncbi:ATP-binding cassette domain-containing protein [Candidatus Bipolaricaulota bacterium]|nr:ATP-binding cassette domain-containing protein [Candidatus Bipolaricaulota bacterium]MBS3814693.1 ATP-binding cassette domain-containing protein [Candidatus Bipolaricaulota bacterium]MBS3825840.1 ATP-binding cassette domain-containing protein [Candidatus Bipolaricaulota bacterium]
MGAIETNGLIKDFGELRAVDGVTFEVQEGEIFGFLGPNGAGKTTTVRMITGVLKPDSGRAYIDGINVVQDPIPAKERIGIAPEEANAYIDLTARGNMQLAGELYGVPKKERRRKSDTLLEEFGLGDRADSKVKGFSKGMKQRLILAMALINDPPILFLDEPTAGLDVASQQLIKERIGELNGEGKTIFLTTHNISEADKLCDRVAIINKGQIATIDSPEKLKATIQSTQSVLISFASNDFSQAKLKELKEGLQVVQEIEKEGDKYRLYGSDPGEIVEKVVDFARKENLNIVSLNTSGPSLEEVFTHLTAG